MSKTIPPTVVRVVRAIRGATKTPRHRRNTMMNADDDATDETPGDAPNEEAAPNEAPAAAEAAAKEDGKVSDSELDDAAGGVPSGGGIR